MAEKEIKSSEKKRPKYSNNCFSVLHFFPSNKLISTGVKRLVTVKDIWELQGATKTERVLEAVTKGWEEQLKQEKPSLSSVLFGMSSGILGLAVFLQFLNMMCQMVPSIVLPYLINWITFDQAQYDNITTMIQYAAMMNITFDLKIALPTKPEHPEEYWGWIYAGIVGLAGILSTYFENHAIVLAQLAVTRLRAGIMLLVYKKALTASTDASPPSGKIMTLLTSDVNIIGMMFPQTMQFIMTPVQLIVIMVLLWRQIDAYSLISLGFLILVLPVAGFAGKKMFALFGLRQAAADSRVKLVTELVNAIRIVKYYAWEVPMNSNIMKSREGEIKMLQRVFRWANVLFLAIGSAPVIATGLTFIFYALYSTPNLTSIFTALNLLTLLRVVFIMLPMTFQSIAQILASIGRVQEYLMTPDAEIPEHDADDDGSKEPLIEIKEASFSWTKATDTPALKNLTMTVDKSKKLTMIAGLVGSGKSALAGAIIGLVHKTAGSIKVRGSIAYVPQTAWIMNATVKENILFGKPFDKAKYDKVVNAAALISDFKLMPAGDETEIGERGVNLSGGQRQRISIARSLYSDCDIYILDDPLSAVDAHVGKHIFREAIKTYLKDKLIILITNNLQFLPEGDEIVYLDTGNVVAQGGFKKLVKSNDRFKALMDEHGIFATKVKKEEKAAKVEQDNAAHSNEGTQYEAEDKEQGAVAFKIYGYYLKNAGLANTFIVMIMFILQAGSQVAMQWWLQYWPKDYVERLTTGKEDLGQLYYIGIFSILNFVGVFFNGFSFIFAMRMVVNSARRMHKAVMDRTLRAPISFFDTTPMGRIIARFSTDITIVDTQILGSVWQAFIAFFTIIGALASVALGSAWILIAVPPFAVLYWYVQARYRKTSIEVQRLEATTRAPLFSLFSETLSGINTIRAYKKQEDFFKMEKDRLELHNSVYYALRYTQSWFGFSLGFIGAAMQIITFFVIVGLKIYVPGDSSLYVIALSAAPQITQLLKMLATAITNLEVQMNAVERIEEYTHVPQEPPAFIEGHRPDKEWPNKGEVKFENFSYRYRDGLPLVLKDINITIKAGERVGIVGRTGSGKSTLLGALYRLAEPATGRVVIDDLDTTTIGVEDLRSKLSIIPQEPQLFVGDLRYNLDPFDKHSDEELWNALSIAGLKEFVTTLEKKLREPVVEGGTNYSVGQRQLICLARALLRRSRILVLDEATASVDFDTDVLIQKAIRSSFPNTTLLVIAHRLNTVMDMNRILALNAGEVVEFESPKKLIEDKNSMLYGMVQATGKANAKHLKKLALGQATLDEALKATANLDDEAILPNSPPPPSFDKQTKAQKKKKLHEKAEEEEVAAEDAKKSKSKSRKQAKEESSSSSEVELKEEKKEKKEEKKKDEKKKEEKKEEKKDDKKDDKKDEKKDEKKSSSSKKSSERKDKK